MAGAIRSDVPREDPWNVEKKVHRTTPLERRKERTAVGGNRVLQTNPGPPWAGFDGWGKIC
jgi:hypothetical protein